METRIEEDPALRRAKIWFGPKTIGYGWGPVSWEGWLLVAGLALFLIGATRLTAFILTGPWDLGAAVVVIFVVGFTAFHVLSRKHMSPDVDSGT